MARIRTIKPEFPQSESMGRVSRDARLLFIELWTLCDDSGRTRGNSRMLASLLFPYDNDAPGLIDLWIGELEKEACIVRYIIDGSTYIQILNWLNHQKIDKPSPSKIPEFVESSRTISNPREDSSVDQGVDQGPRTKDQGPKRKAAPSFDAYQHLCDLGVDSDTANDFITLRKSKKAAITKTAIKDIDGEARKAGISLDSALRECYSRGWAGFKAEWLSKANSGGSVISWQDKKQAADDATSRALYGARQTERLIEGVTL